MCPNSFRYYRIQLQCYVRHKAPCGGLSSYPLRQYHKLPTQVGTFWVLESNLTWLVFELWTDYPGDWKNLHSLVMAFPSVRGRPMGRSGMQSRGYACSVPVQKRPWFPLDSLDPTSGVSIRGYTMLLKGKQFFLYLIFRGFRSVPLNPCLFPMSQNLITICWRCSTILNEITWTHTQNNKKDIHLLSSFQTLQCSLVVSWCNNRVSLLVYCTVWSSSIRLWTLGFTLVSSRVPTHLGFSDSAFRSCQLDML